MPGRTCWCLARASRAAVVDTTERYFELFGEALLRARHSVLILGWDIHSRARLHRGAGHPWPARLGRLLARVGRERPDLRIRILTWDFSVLFAFEREIVTESLFNLRMPPNVRFRRDDCHPPGAAQHQKVVAIDDRLAFVGGMDLTMRRWDTSEHLPCDPRRVDPRGRHYGPFHDVQMAVEGEAARVLADLARDRWYLNTGERLAPAPPLPSPWSPSLEPDFVGVDVGIARTSPGWGPLERVDEVERLYLDSIASAERSLYLESQYVTSDRIADALAARLEERGGPEIVLLSTLNAHGWLEQHTMDALRNDVIRRLRRADHEGRLRVVYPAVQAGETWSDVFVHAKLSIVDDRLLRVASSNLTNRSMGLDTECDAVVEAAGPRAQEIAAGIRRVRARLLGMHLGWSADQVERFLRAHGDSLVAVVDAGAEGAHRLERLDPGAAESLLRVAPDRQYLDPPRPMVTWSLRRMLLPKEVEHQAAFRRLTVALRWAAVATLGVAGLAWLWRRREG